MVVLVLGQLGKDKLAQPLPFLGHMYARMQLAVKETSAERSDVLTVLLILGGQMMQAVMLPKRCQTKTTTAKSRSPKEPACMIVKMDGNVLKILYTGRKVIGLKRRKISG